jgi:hypothetical protein
MTVKLPLFSYLQPLETNLPMPSTWLEHMTQHFTFLARILCLTATSEATDSSLDAIMMPGMTR